MSEETKPYDEQIVDLLCEGRSVKQIIADLGITSNMLDNYFYYIRTKACLPTDKRTYKARKSDIQRNVALWNAYRFRQEAAHEAYLKSLTTFDF